MQKPNYVVWKDDAGADRYVPWWAPDRIISLAAMKPGAVIVETKPEGAVSWHPEVDR